jgi:xyloglucan-specific exo-beta-1,4-glucanase
MKRRLNLFLLRLTASVLVLLNLHACTQVTSVESVQNQTQIAPVLVRAKAPPAIRKPSSKQDNKLFTWRNVNIQGMGYVTGLVINSTSPYDVYVRTDVGGAYRFDRKNKTWLPLMDMFDTNFSGGGIGVESIATDRLTNRIYAGVNRNSSTFKDGEKPKYKYSGEILVSSNRGITWQPTGLGKHNVYMGPNQAYRSDTGERLAVDPNKSDLIYFASRRDGLWKKDGSADWVRVSGGLPEPSGLPEYQKDGKENKDIPGFTFVAFDKANSSGKTQTIYVGVHGSGVWRSTDGGNSWNNIEGAKNALRAAVASDGTLYVTFGTWGSNGQNTSGSIRKYSNGKWVAITPDGEGRVYSAITVQPNQPNTIMAVADKFVYMSSDGGQSWNKQTMFMGAYDANNPKDKVNPTAPGYYQSYASTGAASITFDPSNSKKVWWTNGWGVASSDDVTVKTPVYQWLMNNLEELDSNMVRVPPKPKKQGGADLLSATHDKIGFRHVSRYEVPTKSISPQNININPSFKWAHPDWKVYPVPFPHVAGATGMDYSYNNPDYAAFVGFHQWQGSWGIHGVTSDNGKTWKAFESIPTEELWKSDKSGKEKVYAIGGQIAMSPTNPKNMVWAPSWGTWTHYTKDGGKTWQLARNLDYNPPPQPFDDKNNDHLHYQALPKSWSNSISPWLSSYILAADRKDPEGQTFYYYDVSGFYYSSDGGASWSKSQTNNFPGWLIRPTIISNPTQQGDVWISFARNPEDVNGNPLYRSTDGGKTFNKVASVKTCEFLTFGRGKSQNQPYIYIFGTIGNASKSAIYKSEDMGKSWIRISDPDILQFPGITHMEGDMRTPNLIYVALTGRGIMVGETKQ